MTTGVLVNDTVRIKVKFLDLNPVTGAQIPVAPTTVVVTIKKSDDSTVLTQNITVSGKISDSEYYYDFTPASADTYKISFVGSLSGGTSIAVNQQLYVSTSTDEYKPTVTLEADEMITFAPDIYPIYLDPEELLTVFPDASLIEIGEMIHHYSLEIKEIYNLGDDIDGSTLPFTILEYIKAAAACELSRTYGFGGDDEISLKLGDLEINNRSAPRQVATRSNATTWCQIAASLRREVLAKRVSIKGVMPKGFPSSKTKTSGKRVDPSTGKYVYLSDVELYGPGRTSIIKDEPSFDRDLRQYD